MKSCTFINYSNLSKTQLFSRIPVMDIPKAVECLEGYARTFSPNELIFKNNGTANHPGIVLSGSLTVTQLFPDGSTVLVKTINPGELFGVFVEVGMDESTYVTASTQSSVLFLKLPVSPDSKACICKYRMVIMENLVKILIKNNIYLNQKIKIISRHTIREKLLQFFQIQSGMQKSRTINLNMNREKLAEYVCSDRSAVSRELSNMVKDNLIELKGKTVTLL